MSVPERSLDGAEVGDHFGCVHVDRCQDVDGCWSAGHCMLSRDESRRILLATPDPKPIARIKNPPAVTAKKRSDRVCRCGCGKPATDGHHILPRSLGGDDVRENVMGVWHDCHMLYEFGGTEDRDEMAELLGSRLRDDEILYVLDKRGDGAGREFLRRYYKLTDERLVRVAGPERTEP